MIPSNWRDLTATLVFKDNWPQRNAMFCDGLTGPKYLVSQSHYCALCRGCGISFCGGFVNSAKPLSENSQTKIRALGRMPPLRVCFARSNERPARLVRSSTSLCEPSVHRVTRVSSAPKYRNPVRKEKFFKELNTGTRVVSPDEEERCSSIECYQFVLAFVFLHAPVSP